MRLSAPSSCLWNAFQSGILIVTMVLWSSCQNRSDQTGSPAETSSDKNEQPSPEPESGNDAPPAVSVSFKVRSSMTSSEPYTDEDPVGHSSYSNKVYVKVDGKSILVDSYQCSAHGAGTCGEAGEEYFDPSQLILPASLSRSKVLDDVVVGEEIERAWSRYRRYVALERQGKVIIYRYIVPDQGEEVDESELKRIKVIEPEREPDRNSRYTDTRSSDNFILKATASSVLDPYQGYNYEADNVWDDDLQSWWSPKNSQKSSSWIRLSFTDQVRVEGIRIHGGSHFPYYRGEGDLFLKNYRIRVAKVRFSDGSQEIIQLQDEDAIQSIEFASTHLCNWISLEPLDLYPTTKWRDICISYLMPVVR